MNTSRIVKGTNGVLYEVQRVSMKGIHAVRLSAYDGMPMGPVVILSPHDLIPEDARRIAEATC